MCFTVDGIVYVLPFAGGKTNKLSWFLLKSTPLPDENRGLLLTTENEEIDEQP